jgi:predicted dehydrogenase
MAAGARPFRFGVSGYGWAARMHADAITRAGHHVVGVAGPHPGRRDEFAAAHGCEVSVDTVAELVATEGLDALVVCSPNVHHHADATAAIDAGVHVLLEKPVTVTLAECDDVAARSRAAGVTVGTGHMWRHRDEVVAMRDSIARGDLGRIVRTHGYGIHAQWGPSGWFVDPARAGGGALIDMGIHAIDTVRFLLGDPMPVRVQASLGRGEYSDVAVDDDGIVLIDWDNGVRSVVEFGWHQPVLEGLEADTKVYGTGGTARIWPGHESYEVGYQHCSPPMYEAQVRDFVAACRGGREPVASLAVGRVALGIVLEAYQSAG